MRLVVLADTHLKEGVCERLPAAALAALGEADGLLLAGDITTRAALSEFEELATTYAVLGNNDHELVGILPPTLELELEGVRLAMVHDAGPEGGRSGRLLEQFPGARVVVFGHSHVPCDAFGPGGQLLFNPGSATQRRRQPHHTFGLLELRDGEVASHSVVVV